MKTDDAPLVSFIVLSYNQERYIEEALQGALAQDYAPMEIIYSDDASTDDTWRRGLACLQAAKSPYRILTRRAAVNTGISENFNSAVRLSSGRYIILAAGDDISLPLRTREVVRLFEADDGTFAVGCDYEAIDETGQFVGIRPGTIVREPCDAETLAVIGPNVAGAVAAYHRDVFDKFGDLSRHIINEDLVLEFRAGLLGNVVPLSQPLVRYRMHSGSAMGSATSSVESFTKYVTSAVRLARSVAMSCESRVDDVDVALATLQGDPRLTKIRQAAVQRARITRNLVALHEGRPTAYLSWLWKILNGTVRPVDGLRSLLMAGFPRLWFWHIGRQSRLIERRKARNTPPPV